jgi:hypothetical protein
MQFLDRQNHGYRDQPSFRSEPSDALGSRIGQIGGFLRFLSGSADTLKMSPIGGTFMSVKSSAPSSGLAALATGSQRLSQYAEQIANPDSPSVTSSLLDLNQSLLLAETGANLIGTSNKMLGTLLDALA